MGLDSSPKGGITELDSRLQRHRTIIRSMEDRKVPFFNTFPEESITLPLHVLILLKCPVKEILTNLKEDYTIG